jgi:NAD(P)H-nitrite reductase large subunit
MKFEHTQSYENNFGKKTRLIWFKLVTTVVPESKEILLDNNAKIYDKLVLATGSKPNKYGWPGQDLQGVTVFITSRI